MSKYITIENLKKFLQTLQSSYSATSNKFGGIKIGYQNAGNNTAVQLDEHGKAYVAVAPYDLPQATADALGGIKIGYSGIHTAVQLDEHGKAFVAVSPYLLPQATDSALGGIKIGYSGTYTAVQLDEHGKAYVAVSPYELPKASSTVLGGIQNGTNSGVDIDGNGIIKVKYLPNSHDESSHTEAEPGDVNNYTGSIPLSLQYYRVSSFHHNIFPYIDHANAIVWVGGHGGSDQTTYGHQLGFSGNGNLYYRHMSNNGWRDNGAWNTILNSRMVGLNNTLTQTPTVPADGDYIPVELTTAIITTPPSHQARSQKLVVKVPYQSLSVQSVSKGNVALENGKMMTFAGWNGRISSGTDDNVISISGFSGHQAGKVSKYYLQITTTDYEDIQNTISVPSSVKWANGVPPFMSPGSIIEIIFTSTDGTTYTGVWAKYY